MAADETWIVRGDEAGSLEKSPGWWLEEEEEGEEEQERLGVVASA